MKDHSWHDLRLTRCRDPGRRQGVVGSLTGAVASQTVTEAPNGPLRLGGHQPQECNGRRGLDCEANTPSRGESRA
jgi:hypothetical protein